MRRYALFLLRHRLAVTVLILLALSCSFWAMPRLKIDLSTIPIFEANAEAKREVEEYQRTFPDRRIDYLIVVEWPTTVGRPELEVVLGLEEKLRALTGVLDVVSLATARVVERESGLPRTRNFLELASEGSVASEVKRHPLFERVLLSADGRATPLLVTSRFELGDPRRNDLLIEVEAVVADEIAPPARTRILGGPVVERTMSSYIRRDMAQSVAIEAICFIILLPFMFRTFRGMILPLATVGTAVVLNFGWMVLTGKAVTVLGVATPGLIVIIALCDAIHLMHRFEEALAVHGEKRRAILEMMDSVGRACVYTSLTTSLGFLSLLVARHAAVRDFAISVSIGVLIAFATVVTVLPLLLSYWPAPRAHREGLAFLDRLTYGRRRLTVGIVLLGVALSAAGIARINVDSSWLGELPASDPIVRDLAWYESQFNGFLTLEAHVSGDLDSAAAVAALERLERRMLPEEGITGVESYTGWVREMAGNPKSFDDRNALEGLALLRLVDADFPVHLLRRDFGEGRIIFRSRDVGTRRYTELRDTLEAELNRLPEGLEASVAGYSLMAVESNGLVVTTMMQSLMVSMVAISLFMSIGYRSVRVGLIAFVPNTLPIIAGLGLTGWLGIDLRIGIVIVYCAGMGLAVDDSVHLISRFTQERAADPHATNRQLLVRSMRTTGKALVITSVVLSAGALSYLPSSFQSLHEIGLLLTSIIVTALALDLFLLPILLEKFLPEQAREAAGEPEPALPAK